MNKLLVLLSLSAFCAHADLTGTQELQRMFKESPVLKISGEIAQLTPYYEIGEGSIEYDTGKKTFSLNYQPYAKNEKTNISYDLKKGFVVTDVRGKERPRIDKLFPETSLFEGLLSSWALNLWLSKLETKVHVQGNTTVYDIKFKTDSFLRSLSLTVVQGSISTAFLECANENTYQFNSAPLADADLED